jgi:hypothetical protein
LLQACGLLGDGEGRREWGVRCTIRRRDKGRTPCVGTHSCCCCCRWQRHGVCVSSTECAVGATAAVAADPCNFARATAECGVLARATAECGALAGSNRDRGWCSCKSNSRVRCTCREQQRLSVVFVLAPCKCPASLSRPQSSSQHPAAVPLARLCPAARKTCARVCVSVVMGEACASKCQAGHVGAVPQRITLPTEAQPKQQPWISAYAHNTTSATRF